MRRRARLIPYTPVGHVNVTPMIDVVMCLIIFFLIVGKLAADQRARIRLPGSTVGLAEKTRDVVLVNVVRDPAGGASGGAQVVLDSRSIPWEGLVAALRDEMARKPGSVVELRGSRDLPYDAIARVIRACKDAGVDSVRLATERIQPSGPGGGS